MKVYDNSSGSILKFYWGNYQECTRMVKKMRQNNGPGGNWPYAIYIIQKYIHIPTLEVCEGDRYTWESPNLGMDSN